MDTTVTVVEPHDQVVLVSVRKSTLDDRAARQLEEEVSAAAAATPGLPIVLDMSKLKFAPSVALSALAQLWKGLNLTGRSLSLVHVNPQIRGILSVTRLDSLLGIYPSLDEALLHLGKK